MVGHVGHALIILDRHWVVGEHDLVDQVTCLVEGQRWGQNYSEVPDSEGHNHHRLLSPGVLEEGSKSRGHPDHGSGPIE